MEEGIEPCLRFVRCDARTTSYLPRPGRRSFFTEEYDQRTDSVYDRSQGRGNGGFRPKPEARTEKGGEGARSRMDT